MEYKASPELKEFARRLLSLETTLAGIPASSGAPAAFHVCDKLRTSLGKFMGAGGFRSLQARALVMASLEVPLLGDLEVRSDGSLGGFAELEGKHDISAGEIILVAHLIKLLVTFIGPALTLALVQDAWPHETFDSVDFGTGDKL